MDEKEYEEKRHGRDRHESVASGVVENFCNIGKLVPERLLLAFSDHCDAGTIHLFDRVGIDGFLDPVRCSQTKKLTVGRLIVLQHHIRFCQEKEEPHLVLGNWLVKGVWSDDFVQ